jgi:hypothetical protein
MQRLDGVDDEMNILNMKSRRKQLNDTNWETSQIISQDDDNDDKNRLLFDRNNSKKVPAGTCGLVILVVMALLALTFSYVSPTLVIQSVKMTISTNNEDEDDGSLGMMRPKKFNQEGIGFNDGAIQRNIGDDVLISFHFEHAKDDYHNVSSKSGDSVISLGPHGCQVTIRTPICAYPNMAIRMKGDALVFIPLQPSGPNTLSAAFYLPISGTYSLDARWYGCELPTHLSPSSLSFTTPTIPLVVEARDTTRNTSNAPLVPVSKTPLFPPGFWRSQRRYAVPSQALSSEYIWTAMETRYSDQSPAYFTAESSQGKASVVMEGNPINLQGLAQLSNYEVVCWVGTKTAEVSREMFLSLRSQLAPRQRPFKFHYNKITDLTDPENSMNERRMSRKCKQTWVILDELELSQAEFTRQVIHFLRGIESCMHDKTWSIWMFTVTTNNPRACHSPSSMRYSHLHPCNDALFQIFESRTLPWNVRLVDTTDITNAQFGENHPDVSATIAMRIAALIGDQVQTWRQKGQIGKVDGLHRNGTVEDDAADECHFVPPPS